MGLCVCAGGCACSNIFVATPIFALGRPPLTYWSAQCKGAARARRSGVAAIACTWLTVPSTHELVLLRQHRSYSRASRLVLQRLRRAAPEHVPHAHLVSRVVLAARARAERCREHPRSGSSVRCSGTDFAEFLWPPRSFAMDSRHCSEVYRPKTNFCQQDSIYLSRGPELFTLTLPGSAQV